MAIREEKTRVTLSEGGITLAYTKGWDTEPIFLTCNTMGSMRLSMQDIFDLEVLMEEYMRDWNKCKEEQLRNAVEEIPPTISEEVKK